MQSHDFGPANILIKKVQSRMISSHCNQRIHIPEETFPGTIVP